MKTREDALKAIEEAEVKIAEAKAILKQEKEIVLEYSYGCSIINTYYVDPGNGRDKEFLENARYRDTREQAERVVQREREVNRLEARALKINPDWKADWGNTRQRKCYIFYNWETYKYEKNTNVVYRFIGVPYMSEETANQLVEELNSGRYKL